MSDYTDDFKAWRVWRKDGDQWYWARGHDRMDAKQSVCHLLCDRERDHFRGITSMCKLLGRRWPLADEVANALDGRKSFEIPDEKLRSWGFDDSGGSWSHPRCVPADCGPSCEWARACGIGEEESEPAAAS